MRFDAKYPSLDAKQPLNSGLFPPLPPRSADSFQAKQKQPLLRQMERAEYTKSKTKKRGFFI